MLYKGAGKSTPHYNKPFTSFPSSWPWYRFSNNLRILKTKNTVCKLLTDHCIGAPSLYLFLHTHKTVGVQSNMQLNKP